MPSALVRPDGLVSTDADGRVIVGEAGDPCCCGPRCDRFIRLTWCCSASIVAWARVNDPQCEAYDPSALTIPTAADVLVIYRTTDNDVGDEDVTCYIADHASVVERWQLPADAAMIRTPRVEPGRFRDEIANPLCTNPECPPCPIGCCGSKTPATSVCGMPACCECGESYSLVASATGSYVATFRPLVSECPSGVVSERPPIAHSSGSLRWNGRADYLCPNADTGGQARLVGGISNTGLEKATTHTAAFTIGCCDGPVPGFTDIRVETTQDSESAFALQGFPPLDEGCGLTREAFASLVNFVLRSVNITHGNNGVEVTGGDLWADCSGSSAQVEVCTPSWPCVPGGPGRIEMEWSGEQGCLGGRLSLLVRGRAFGAMAAACTIVEGGTCSIFCPPSTFLEGMIEYEAQITIVWDVVDRVPCDVPPCGRGEQRALGGGAVTLGRAAASLASTGRRLSALEGLGLALALARGGGCHGCT